jgi:WD40 repeat protein
MRPGIQWERAEPIDLSVPGLALTRSLPLFSPDGRMAISGSDDGNVGFWSVVSGQEVSRAKAATASP